MKIYMVGICGTGMAAMAGLLKSQGHSVAGSDAGCYPPMSHLLERLKIPVFPGYSASNPEQWGGCDLAIIGNVVRSDNPEARWIMERKIPYLSFPDSLRTFCLQDREPIVITGTHGKTTTSSLMVSVLSCAGEDPGFMVGGILKEYGTNFKMGSGRWFVIEGDEYDTAFFDKTPKFLHYSPKHAIITSLEFDHADIYPDLQSIEDEFLKFVSLLPDDGELIVCDQWPSIKKVVGSRKHRSYGLSTSAQWRIDRCETDCDVTTFSVSFNGSKFGDFQIPLPGEHNALNALAVLAMCHHLGIEKEIIAQGLACASGAKRRQEVVGEGRGITIIDDFAHHPTAVLETLKALKARYPGRRLIAVFEPRTNTSRRAVFQGRYPTAFIPADVIVVREVAQPEKAPEDDRFSSLKLVSDLKALDKRAFYFPDTDAILNFLLNFCRSGDVVAVMSNGDFDGLCSRLDSNLQQMENGFSGHAAA